MNTLFQLHRILELHKLIQSERTGHYPDLAARLHVSIRTISNYFDELREMGAKIGFDELHATYYYKNSFDMIYHLKSKYRTLTVTYNRKMQFVSQVSR